ncbi:bifunctional metallophosphatase/5'-nucleotidase [Longirhabdus pacifica]|uniref:bifunctional metallophosphatase/5'-nucleotidase n=1 Tax=Longirhabdus pacifica TaxID=2305227 RepID=UPI00100910DC|nr:bifunctional UDP-sugar hydrolase/5'-nucleotidase [Longirhabdus pacifica]
MSNDYKQNKRSNTDKTVQQVQQTHQLTIIETSDIHGNILPHWYGNNEAMEMGMAKLATIIHEERKKDPHLLLIDNGDLLQGTPLTYHHAKYNHHKPNPMIAISNYLQYDAAIIGNHEFNYGLPYLEQAVKESQFPWLSASTLHKETSQPYFGQPYMIKELENGCKVGILGLTTHYIPNWENPKHIKKLAFEDALQCAKKWVPVLKEKEKVDIVIVSYHGGFEKDLKTGKETEPLTGENQAYQICEEVSGIDVLLTGHQHRELIDEVHNVLIVQPGHQAQRAAKVTLQLIKNDIGWHISEKSGELLSVQGIPADPTVIKMTEPYETDTQQWLDKPIGEVANNKDMLITDPFEARIKEHPFIQFINVVQMEVSGAPISCTSLFDNRSLGFPTHITMRDVVSNYIYPNTLQVIKVSGKDIKAALEQTAAYFAPYDGRQIEVNPTYLDPKPQHYNYDMWEGIEYTIQVQRPIGKRIESITYNGKLLEMDEHYDVVMNNYRASGGGNYDMFQGKPIVKDIPLDVSEIIADYIIEKKKIDVSVNHNWKVIG